MVLRSVALAWRDGAITAALIVTATALGIVTSLGVVRAAALIVGAR